MTILEGDTVESPTLGVKFVVGRVVTETVNGQEIVMVYPKGTNNPLEAYPADNLIIPNAGQRRP